MPQWCSPLNGVLGARPGAPALHAMMVSNVGSAFPGMIQQGQVASPKLLATINGQPSHNTNYAGGGEWFFDIGASSHMSTNNGILASHHVPPNSSHVIVGNGAPLPVTHTSHVSFNTSVAPLHLKNVLVCPTLIKNLISVRALTRDNPVTVEFDAFSFSIKDLQTRTVLLRCNSSGDLYPLRPGTGSTPFSLHADTTSAVWHARLGHLGDDPSPVCFVSLIFPACEWKSTRAMPAELASTFASHLPAQIKLRHLLLS
jgi:hypothetical protein